MKIAFGGWWSAEGRGELFPETSKQIKVFSKVLSLFYKHIQEIGGKIEAVVKRHSSLMFFSEMYIAEKTLY